MIYSNVFVEYYHYSLILQWLKLVDIFCLLFLFLSHEVDSCFRVFYIMISLQLIRLQVPLLRSSTIEQQNCLLSFSLLYNLLLADQILLIPNKMRNSWLPDQSILQLFVFLDDIVDHNSSHLMISLQVSLILPSSTNKQQLYYNVNISRQMIHL